MSSRETIHQKFNEALRELASCDFPHPFPDIFPIAKTEKFVAIDRDMQTHGTSVHGHIEEKTHYIQTDHYIYGSIPIKMRIVIEEPRLDERPDERIYDFKISEEFAISLIKNLETICQGSKVISDKLSDNPDTVVKFKKM